jgi:hypothetical protein
MFFLYIICLFFLFYNCIQSSIGFFSLIPCQWFIWLEIRHERECAGMNLLLRHTPSFSTNGQRDVILKSAHRCARKYIRESSCCCYNTEPGQSLISKSKSFDRFLFQLCSSCSRNSLAFSDLIPLLAPNLFLLFLDLFKGTKRGPLFFFPLLLVWLYKRTNQKVTSLKNYYHYSER